MQAAVKVYTVRAEGESGAMLLTQIEIRCPACGDLRYLVPGHHLRTLRDVLIDVIDQYPEDAGADASAKLQSATRSTFTTSTDQARKAGDN